MLFRVLIEKGADVNAIDKSKLTPLMHLDKAAKKY